ncbi:flavin reductase [Ancylomarina longa]|uniref:Rubredoxin-like domain-containing protein n=1 Tax=Ancylomarina longa TaxID=2487017 RepID=A0A434AYH2_9BACT|nr:flavin reductase [Ancylomarina longa]RUT79534.1 hypothetical protein DLK05_02260 [Ancylomarina longa]
MINFEALFKISYGLYIVSSGDKNKGNGYVANTVFQITSEPPKFATCCNKNNFTSEFIQKHKAFSVSILAQNASTEIFGKFGYKSGKDFDKMVDTQIKYGDTGVPIILNESIAFFECKLVQTIDVGTHLMFIGELVDAQIIDNTKTPLTYLHYRQINKASAPKNAPTYIDKSKLGTKLKSKKSGIYKCIVCGHIYDEDIEEVKFANLPVDWKCPICGADKKDFIIV